MNKSMLGWAFIASIFVGNVYANSYNNGDYGFVVNGKGSTNTLNQKIYEWEQFDGGCYCFHGAGATAINIRVGSKVTDTKSTHTYFRDKLNAYQNKTECETSSNDWLNASNRYHISDLNIYKKPSSGYFSDVNKLWDEIKLNVNNNKPMLVPITHYDPIYSGFGYTEVTGYNDEIGHALIIVGYINFTGQTKYVAIRDTAVDHSDIESDNEALFDYTLSLETLDEYLQSRQMLVFDTKVDADLKSMELSSNTQSEDADIEDFYNQYPSYFGEKKGSNYPCYTSYTCQDFHNGTKIAVHNQNRSLYYNNGSEWYFYQ